MADVMTQVSQIIRDLFDQYDGPITRSLTAKEVPEWDSLGHVQLMVNIENALGVRFASNEFRSYANLGELIDTIDRKKSQQHGNQGR